MPGAFPRELGGLAEGAPTAAASVLEFTSCVWKANGGSPAAHSIWGWAGLEPRTWRSVLVSHECQGPRCCSRVQVSLAACQPLPPEVTWVSEKSGVACGFAQLPTRERKWEEPGEAWSEAFWEPTAQVGGWHPLRWVSV